MDQFTNYHSHTNIDWICQGDLDAAAYVKALIPPLRRLVITDHGFMLYFWRGSLVFDAYWMEDPVFFDRHREWGNRRVRANIDEIRALNNPNIFAGIETDMMKDGRLTHDPVFNDEFDVIILSNHFIPWLRLDSMSEEELKKRWVERVEQMLFTPAADIFGHPMRWLAEQLKRWPVEMVDTVIDLAEKSRITLELNPGRAKPENAVPLLRKAADRGVPVVFGTDSHGFGGAGDFSFHLAALAKAGMKPDDLFMPEVEDFIRRKGRRDTIASRVWS